MLKLNKIKSAADSFLNQYKTQNPATYAAAQQAVGGLLILDGVTGIDNPFGQRKRSGIFGSFIGILLGIAILVFGGQFSSLFGAQNLTADTTGTITAIGAPQTSTSTDSDGNKSTSTTCSVTVKYTVNGKQYSAMTKSQTAGNCNASVGSSIGLKYSPGNPADFDTADSVTTIATIQKFVPFVGLLVLLISGFTFTIRLLCIIFGWKLLKSGRALASTLPAGTDLGTVINEIKQNFTKHLFNFGTGSVQQPITQQVQQPTPQPQVQTPTHLLPKHLSRQQLLPRSNKLSSPTL